MNLKAIKAVVTSRVGVQLLTLRKNSPKIMFAVGIAGVVGTAVLAARATLKLNDILDEAEQDLETAKTLQSVKYSEEDRQRDIVLIYLKTGGKIAKLYAPAAIVGALTIAALTGAHVELNRRNTALMAAYAALDKGFRQYRQRVINALGKDRDDEFRYGHQEGEIVEETKNGPVVKTIKRVGIDGASIYARFFDEGSPNWNKQSAYNVAFLKCQQDIANDILTARGYIFLNEIYTMLGIKNTPEGQIVGWVKKGKGDGYVSFGCFDQDNPGFRDFVNGWTDAVLLDFNVDGPMWEQI